MEKLTKKLIVKGTLKALTGLHIGASKENVEIGGIDNPVIRCVLKKRQPYIPGSSLKGKLRSLLQQAIGEADEKQTGSPVCQLFGAADNSDTDFDNLPKENMEYLNKFSLRKNKKLLGHRSRLIVRDAYLTQTSEKQLFDSEYTDMPYTEMKMENHIKRIEGTAENPRQQERIPADAEFDIEFIINVFEKDASNKLTDTLKKSLELLNNDYLGGSGSRGYGKVMIDIDWNEMKTINISDLVSAQA